MKHTLALAALALVAPVMPSWGALTPVEMYAKVSPSVWRVQTYDAEGVPLGQGSAVVVAPNVLVTNCHVLKKAKRVSVHHEQARADVKLTLWDPERDVCQLTATALAAPAVALRPSSALLVGQTVYALGNPQGLDLTMSSGLLSGLRRDDNGHVVAIQTSAAISGGSSGGALFDDEGRLIGITTLMSTSNVAQNLNFAVPAEWITELPQRHAKLNAGDKAVALPGTGAGVQRGDEFEYTVTDRYTHTTRRVVYRIDRIEDEKIVYNGGTRIESLAGELLGLETPIGGDMDTMAPPRGWLADELRPGTSWRLSYKGRNPAYEFSYDLTATVHDVETLRTEAGEFEAVRVVYTGWSKGGATGVSFSVNLDVWVAPSLRRVVRFSSDMHNGQGIYRALGSREHAELTRIRRQAPSTP